MKLLLGLVIGLLFGFTLSTGAEVLTCTWEGQCQPVQPPGQWGVQRESQREQYDQMLRQNLNQFLQQQPRHNPC